MKAKNTACRNCTKRKLHCHSTCEEYLQERKEMDAENDKKNKQKNERLQLELREREARYRNDKWRKK